MTSPETNGEYAPLPHPAVPSVRRPLGDRLDVPRLFNGFGEELSPEDAARLITEFPQESHQTNVTDTEEAATDEEKIPDNLVIDLNQIEARAAFQGFLRMVGAKDETAMTLVHSNVMTMTRTESVETSEDPVHDLRIEAQHRKHLVRPSRRSRSLNTGTANVKGPSVQNVEATSDQEIKNTDSVAIKHGDDYNDVPSDDQSATSEKKRRHWRRPFARHKTSAEQLRKKERRRQVARIGGFIAVTAVTIASVAYAFGNRADNNEATLRAKDSVPPAAAPNFDAPPTTSLQDAIGNLLIVEKTPATTDLPPVSPIPPIVQERGDAAPREITNDDAANQAANEKTRLEQEAYNKLAQFTPEDDAAFAEMYKWSLEHPEAAFILNQV